MNSWNGLDFFVFLILVLNTIRGMSRGAGKELIALMCLSVALIFAIKFTVPLADFLKTSPVMVSAVDNKFISNFLHTINAGPLTLRMVQELMYAISLLICFVSVFSVTEACITFSGYAESVTMMQAVAYRKIGAAIGFTRGYIISLIFLSILTLHIFHNEQNRFVSGSFFVKLFDTQIKKFDDMIASQEPENYQELYKEQPVNEHEIIQHLGQPEETPQKTN
jgi:hypothetical protein